MSDYDILSDEELITRLREGDRSIMDFILDKYKNLVRSHAGSMYILGADREDLIQEGMIGLFKAIREYDFGRDAGFYTFADLCISRQMYTAVQNSHRFKHAPLNSYVSLYKAEGQEGGSPLLELVASGMEDDPEKQVIDRENLERLEDLIDKELSGFEKEVLDLYRIGMSYSQIAKVLGRDEKSTDNALQRLKNKLRKAVKNQ